MSNDPAPVVPTMSSTSDGPDQAPQLRILLNGEPRQVAAGTTVGALIAQLGYAAGTVAVERNRDVVPRRAHDVTELQAGDEVELVTFVGGG